MCKKIQKLSVVCVHLRISFNKHGMKFVNYSEEPQVTD